MDEKAEKSEFECKMCNMTFSSKEEFEKHRDEMHKDWMMFYGVVKWVWQPRIFSFLIVSFFMYTFLPLKYNIFKMRRSAIYYTTPHV